MSQKIFHLQPWTPKIREAAHSLINKIHTAAPELEILFMGAAALGLPGKNDIDLDILCHKDDISSYTKKLLPILGVAKKPTIILLYGILNTKVLILMQFSPTPPPRTYPSSKGCLKN